jgi:Cys-tRNA(Pro) deacylase
MSHAKTPATPAVRLLRQNSIEFVPRFYSYEEKGGTAVSARELGVEEHSVIKTLIMQDEQKKPIIVLMHGDRQVSTKELARTLGVKAISPAPAGDADRHSGYQVGGTSPFATRRPMPVYMEETILNLPRIFINGGRRGFLLEIDPRDAQRLLQPVLVKVGI